MTIPILRLHEGDAPFRSDPAESFTIPARFYHDAGIHEAEKTAIFYRNWWFCGHRSQLPQPGNYITTKVMDQNIVVVRTRDGSLKAYYNVCQHRGHELVQGSGKTVMLTCPYHAWAYDLDGQLRSARNTERMAGFKACEFALKPVRVEEYCGLVFVNLDPDAVPFADQAEGLGDELRHYCPEIEQMVFAQRDTYDVEANWKLLIDNFLECYHCDPAHKDFVDLVDMKSYKSIVHKIYSSHCSSKVGSTTSNAFHIESGRDDFGYGGWFVWPNLTIWIYPGEPNVSTLQMIPAGPDRTIEYQDWFIPTPTPSKQLSEAMAYQKDVLQPEDIALCESVHRGLKSNGYNQGRFVIDEDESELSEHAVHHFQRLVVEALGAELDGPRLKLSAGLPAE